MADFTAASTFLKGLEASHAACCPLETATVESNTLRPATVLAQDTHPQSSCLASAGDDIIRLLREECVQPAFVHLIRVDECFYLHVGLVGLKLLLSYLEE